MDELLPALSPEPIRDAEDRADSGGAPPPEERVTSSPPQRTPDPLRRAQPPWLSALGLAEGGLLADIGVLLDLISIYIPLLGGVLSPAVPTPFALLMLRRGFRVTLLSSCVAAFLITVVAGPHYGWRMGLEAVVGLLLGWAMRQRWRPLVVVALGTVLVGTVLFAASLGLLVVTGLPFSDVVSQLRNAFNSLAFGIASGAQILGLRHAWLNFEPTYRAIEATALALWPLLLYIALLAASLGVVIFYYAIANITLRVLGYDVVPFPPRWVERWWRGATRQRRDPPPSSQNQEQAASAQGGPPV